MQHEDGVGYHGDLNETFLVGKCDDESRKLVNTAFECLATGISLVKPGTMYRDIGPAITKTASAAGLSVVRSYCGHGIGSLFHTSPNVPHYAKNKARARVRTPPRGMRAEAPLSPVARAVLRAGQGGDEAWAHLHD